MTKHKLINNPNMKFWISESVPTDHVIIEGSKSVKILFKKSLKQLLSEQKERLHPQQIKELIQDLHAQMEHLHKHHLTCIFFNIDDIVMINGSYYCINDKHVLPIVNKHITISEVFKDSMFLPYELNKHDNKTIMLPKILSEKTYSYSLAVLALYCLFNIDINTRENAIDVLKQIEGTELYWCLNRCLSTQPKDRIILFI